MVRSAGIAVEGRPTSLNEDTNVHLSEADGASPVYKAIEQRAFVLHELGGEHGHDVEHWLEVEREILAEAAPPAPKV